MVLCVSVFMSLVCVSSLSLSYQIKKTLDPHTQKFKILRASLGRNYLPLISGYNLILCPPHTTRQEAIKYHELSRETYNNIVWKRCCTFINFMIMTQMHKRWWWWHMRSYLSVPVCTFNEIKFIFKRVCVRNYFIHISREEFQI